MGDVRQPGRVTFLIEQARETALREARDAVAALSDHYELCICDECCGTQAALDAIDALRGES